MVDIAFSYVAVKPITAEHPIGSGTIVTYQPGDVVPAEDWGRAADNLVELEKIVRLAVNIGLENVETPRAQAGPGPGLSDPTHAYLAYEGKAPLSLESEATDEPEDEVEEDALHVTEESEWPAAGSGGWWTLSDGSRVRGKAAAHEAQAALEAENV